MLNTLNFHITNNCNFRCKHCLYSSGENKITEMSFDEITNLIDQFHEICDGKGTINLYGGEVFMRKDIFKIFNYIKSKGLKIGLTSNMNFTEDFLQKIYDLNLSRYTLNLDGGNNKSHDWLRNEKGHFDKTIQIIKELKILGKYVAINSVLHKNNISEIIDILKLCKSLKIDAISFYLFTFLGRGYKIKDLMIGAKDWLETKKKIEKWIAKNNPSFIIIWERSYASKGELRNLSSCLCEGYEHEVIDVACDGNIYYCGLLLSVKGNSLGNIKNQNLKEILKNREKMNLRNKIGCAALAIQENGIKKLIDPRESFGNIIPICPYDWEILQGEKTTAKNKFIHIS